MKAYSVDLRQKIIEIYKNKEWSIRGVAERFKVARSVGQKLLKQHQQRGSLADAASRWWHTAQIG